MIDLQQIRVAPDASVGEAIKRLDQSGVGIALILDADDRLLRTITDGDIRGAILDGVLLTSPASSLKRADEYQTPVVAPMVSSPEERLQLMRQRVVRHLPLLDEVGRVVDVALLADYLDPPTGLTAVVFAGGYGSRLQPLTANTPKPMLKLGKHPLLEIIIGRLRAANIQDIYISTHYHSEQIVGYFGDGERFGVNIQHVHEDAPLGTAGALSLIRGIESSTLIVNGDILTDLDFRSIVDFHSDHDAVMTVAVRRYDVQVPYGVIESEGINVSRLTEKPLLEFFINAGIYVIEPSVYRHIPTAQRFDMTDVISVLLDQKSRVISFPIREYWLDIGQHADYEQAAKDIKSGRFRFEPER